MGVIVKPLITEKSNMLSEKLGQYVFIVDLGASKPEIIKAVEEMYHVEVTDISTMVYRGKRKFRFTKSGKTHNRKGDNAEMCMMELVDFNELMLEQKVAKKSSEAAPKRTRRGKKKVVETTSDAVEVASENVKSTDSTTPEANASKSSEKE